MTKILKITVCGECRYISRSKLYLDQDYQKEDNQFYCHLKHKSVGGGGWIPKWCPLEDEPNLCAGAVVALDVLAMAGEDSLFVDVANCFSGVEIINEIRSNGQKKTKRMARKYFPMCFAIKKEA